MSKELQEATNKLTDMQKRFVASYMTNGGDATAAVKASGSKTKHPSSIASQLMQNSRVRAAIYQMCVETLDLELLAKSMKRLGDLVSSSDDSTALGAVNSVLKHSKVSHRVPSQSPTSGKVVINLAFDDRRADGTHEAPVDDTPRGQKPEVPHTATPKPLTVEADFRHVDEGSD